MANQVFKCKVCGGELAWDPTKQKLRCKFCDEEYDVNDFNIESPVEDSKEDNNINNNISESDKGKDASELGYTESTDESYNDIEDLRVYKCSYCGAEIVTDSSTMATHCVYCNNAVVLTEQLATDFHPKYLIPFKIEKSAVTKMYMNYIKKPFTPDSFIDENHINMIKGVYVPFWLFDMKVEGEIEADCDKVTHSSSATHNYTHHHIYDVKRKGSILFNDIPVDASKKIPNDAMDSLEPFNYKELVKFDMSYLPGFLAERYTDSDEAVLERATTRSKTSMVSILKNTIKNYTSTNILKQNIKAEKVDASYALLPVYLLFTKYDDIEYIFAVNGQTGKICGNTPIDKSKVLSYFISRFLVSTVISTIVAAIGMFIYIYY